MNKVEMSKLLTAISTFDNRKIATETVEAWHLALGDLDYEEASQAVLLHFQNSTEWCLPAHIRTNVRIVRDRREREERINRPRIEPPKPDYEFNREEHERMVVEFKKMAGELNG